MIGRDESEGAGGIVLGTEVPGVGFKLLYPLAKARVGLESRWRGFGLG